MGLTFSKLFDKYWGKKDIRTLFAHAQHARPSRVTRLLAPLRPLFFLNDPGILMLGLDCAGKSTILYKLKLGEIQTTIPCTGRNPSPTTF